MDDPCPVCGSPLSRARVICSVCGQELPHQVVVVSAGSQGGSFALVRADGERGPAGQADPSGTDEEKGLWTRTP